MIRYLQVAGDRAAEIPTTFRTAPRRLFAEKDTMARFAASLFAACLAISILAARADTAFTQTAPRPPLPLTPYGKLAAKNEPRESAKRKGEHHRESATRKKEHRENAKKKRELGRVLRKSKSGLSVRSRPRNFSMM